MDDDQIAIVPRSQAKNSPETAQWGALQGAYALVYLSATAAIRHAEMVVG
jgi:hypothetical protein